jgi:hypothetical protein
VRTRGLSPTILRGCQTNWNHAVRQQPCLGPRPTLAPPGSGDRLTPRRCPRTPHAVCLAGLLVRRTRVIDAMNGTATTSGSVNRPSGGGRSSVARRSARFRSGSAKATTPRLGAPYNERPRLLPSTLIKIFVSGSRSLSLIARHCDGHRVRGGVAGLIRALHGDRIYPPAPTPKPLSSGVDRQWLDDLP